MSSKGTQTQANAATVSEAYAIVSAAVSWFIVTGISIAFIVHSVKFFQDLYTKERKSVCHRRTKPKVDNSYKFIGWMTWLSVFFNLICQLSHAIFYFFINDMHCRIAWTILLNTQQFSKLCMYWVFIWRLYIIYKTSAYHYSQKCILCFGIVFIAYAIFMTILISAIVTAEVFNYGNISYPNWCALDEDVFVIAGGAIMMQDIIVAIGFLWAFLSPLKKTIRAVRDTTDSNRNDKMTRKIIYVGTKTTIITSFGTFSTIIVTLLAIITGIGMFAALDPLFNSYCVVLMTAYYPDKYYYEKLCCLFIKCCEKTDKEEDLAEDDRTHNIEPSSTNKTVDSATRASSATATATVTVDTMSALRVAGPNTVKYQDNYAGVQPNKEDDHELEVADCEAP